MAQVKALSVPGIRMWFPSGDHQPPHFHADRPGQWHAVVYILEGAGRMIELKRPPDAKIRSGDRRRIVAGVEANREALLQEWEACQGD